MGGFEGGELFDTISFVPCECADFTIEGCKEACNLVLSPKELIDIGSDSVEDFSCFIHNYPLASVSNS